MRPGEPPTRETAEALFGGLFFDGERYDLSAVGRVKLNMRLGLDAEDTVTTPRSEDILAVVKELVNLQDGKGRSEERRVGKECVRPCRSRRTPHHYKQTPRTQPPPTPPPPNTPATP